MYVTVFIECVRLLDVRYTVIIAVIDWNELNKNTMQFFL